MTNPKSEQELNGVAISDIAIKQPVLITMLMLLAVVVGLLSYRSLPVDLFPSIDVPVVVVVVPYPGAGPQSVAEQVTRPVEEALNTLSGIDTISSTSSEGTAQIQVQFVDTVDSDQAIQDVREKVNTVVPQLPRDALAPIFQRFSLDTLPVLQLAVTGDGSLSPLELRQLIDTSIAPRVQQVEGVGDVTVSGGQERQINVRMDLQRLQDYNVSPAQLVGAISAANANLGLGKITSDEESFSLRAPSQIRDLDDIRDISITGTPYLVSDVAKVTDGVTEVQGYSRLNGEDAISIGVVKRSGTNTADVTNRARAELDQLFAVNPTLRYEVIQDQSTAVEDSVNSSIEEIILAVVAAFLVVLLFFRDLRNTLTTIAGLPIILIATFGAMALFGISINIISLLALSLSVGLVIDDAIVVRENIFRYMEQGYSPRQAASLGTSQVALSVLAMTLTIIAVFLPVALVSGTTGFIFKAFGITVASAMAISLVEAFTLAPMLSANLFKSRIAKQGHAADGAAAPQGELSEVEGHGDVGATGRFYGRILGWTLRHRLVTVSAALVVLALSVVVALGLTFNFLPPQAANTFTINFQGAPGTALSQTDGLAKRAEAVMMQDPDVEAVQSQVGGQGSEESGTFTVRARSIEVADEVRERLRSELAFLPEVVLSTQSAQGDGGTGVTGRTVQVQVQSTRSLADTAPVAQQLEQIAQGVDGLVDVGSTYVPGRPEVVFYISPTQARQYGVTNSDIATAVRALINGTTATTLRQNGNDTDIVVRLEQGQRAGIDDIRNITIPTSAGNVLLANVADVEFGSGPTSIRRTNQQIEIVIGANVAPGVEQGAVQAQLQAQIDQLQVPDGIIVAFGGTQADQNEAFTSLLLAMALSILFVYMVLASQFGSFTQPIVIMLSMPFSFLGAFAALQLAGLALDITGMIGLIMLLGLVVKNSILLVDFTNKLRQGGMEKHAALERAGAVRLRPILMTSITVIAGALPTALGIHFFTSGEGSEFRRGLAVVLIGGMITSTLLTLLIVPTAYSLVEAATQRMSGWFGRGKPAVVPAPKLTLALAGATGSGGGAVPRAPKRQPANATNDRAPDDEPEVATPRAPDDAASVDPAPDRRL